MDVIKTLVERTKWTCPKDCTTMLFLDYTIDSLGLELTINVYCPICGNKVWLLWRYEMDGEIK